MITEEQFTKVIDAFEAQYRLQEEQRKSLQTAFPESEIILKYPTLVGNAVLDMFQEHFKNADAWIEYYMYEIDFGKSFKYGMIDIDNIPVSLRNATELYEIINLQ